MNQSKSLELPQIYVTPQHGALITIISVNLVSILHSDKIALFQIFAMLFSLSAFHVAEIYFLPKYAKPKKWLLPYLLITLLSATIVFTQQSQIILLLTGLLILGSLFILLSNRPKIKTVFHLISFALIIWVSLFGLATQKPKLLLNLFIQLLIYFSFTVAFIHWRLGKLSFQALDSILLFALITCVILHDWSGIIALTSVLTIKWLMIFYSKNFWNKTSLKIIGYEETIFLSIYIFLMTIN